MSPLNSLILLNIALNSVVAISNSNTQQDLTKTLFDLSELAIQGRQYYSNRYPSYYQQYNPQKYQYGHSGYAPNEIPTGHQDYAYYQKPPFFKKTQQSVMDALFSIAQNDDLQCVPKLLCDIAAGGLIGRQGGLNLPLNVDLKSLAAFLSGVNSANMSPVLHFGKAAILGFASKGSSRSCQYAYPECPSDPDKLVQYLNNHNGGFFRFFQGIDPVNQAYAPQYYRPGYFGKSVPAEERIQNQPSAYANDNFIVSSSKGLSFPTETPTSGYWSHRVTFPKRFEDDVRGSPNDLLRFPTESYRGGKKLRFGHNRDEYLDIQRPLPNHVPSPNILPDRTGTGELKLDLEDVEHNYQQSLAYDFDDYSQLLYDSFPNDEKPVRSSRLSFPQ